MVFRYSSCYLSGLIHYRLVWVIFHTRLNAIFYIVFIKQATVKPDLKSEQAVSSKKKKKKKASKESSPTGSTSSQEVAEVATLTAAASNSSGGAGDAPVTADSRLHDDASRSSVNETSDTLATDAPKARKKQVQTNKVFEDNVQSAKDGDAVKPAVSVGE